MKSSEKVKNILVLFLLSFSIALILWITLFSRIGRHERSFIPPFSSYQNIGENLLAVLEISGNIVLFIPIGLAASMVLRLDLWKAAVLGAAFSLLIECCQWFLWLGSFSLDDVIHNSLGTVVGAVFISESGYPQWMGSGSAAWKRNVFFLFVLTAVFALCFFFYQSICGPNLEMLSFRVFRFLWRAAYSFRPKSS